MSKFSITTVLNGKNHIYSLYSYIYIHSKLTNHNIDFASPVILAHDNVKLRLQVKETILIKEHTAYNSLNRNTGSFHLTLW